MVSLAARHSPLIICAKVAACPPSRSWPATTLKELSAYWRTQYDWRKHERALNEWPQFTTEIDGLQIHFIHVRSPHPQALPLVLVHGWPGTFAELTKILAR